MTHLQQLKQIRPTEPFWGRGVTAAYRPFKPGGGGSSPSGPTAYIAYSPACGSTAEQAADNRSTEVRLLPGRLRA